MRRAYRHTLNDLSVTKIVFPFIHNRPPRTMDKLYLAILEQVFSSVLGYSPTPPTQVEKDIKWILSDNPFPSQDGAFASFTDICSYFNINPNYIRRLVRREMERRCSQLQNS